MPNIAACFCSIQHEEPRFFPFLVIISLYFTVSLQNNYIKYITVTNTRTQYRWSRVDSTRCLNKRNTMQGQMSCRVLRCYLSVALLLFRRRSMHALAQCARLAQQGGMLKIQALHLFLFPRLKKNSIILKIMDNSYDTYFT